MRFSAPRKLFVGMILAAGFQATAIESPVADAVRSGELPRFVTVGDSVVDNLTGLMWARNATAAGARAASEATGFAKDMQMSGFCDWRLPTQKELQSLASPKAKGPALPKGHPFAEVTLGCYWLEGKACLNINNGTVSDASPRDQFFIWPVRSYIPQFASASTNPDIEVSSR